MPALVPELVDMASNPLVSTTDLLRRALVVASRLDVPELVGWIWSELNGYTEDVPDYRVLNGGLFVEESYHGSPIPLILPPEFAEVASKVSLHQPIPELMQLAQGGPMLKVYFQPEKEQFLMKMMDDGAGYAARPFAKFSSTQVTGLVERVRSRILDWALDLEKRGILGEGMSFTTQEKLAVQEQHYHFGTVSGSQIQIGSNGSTQTQANTTGADLEALRGLIEALGAILEQDTLKGDTADELRAEVETLKAQAASPKPKWDIIKATARSIKSVAEGAAGNILGQLAQPHAATLFALAAGALGA